jgi:spermidine synthase
VEIDKMVIDLSKKFMPFTASCLDDDRVEVLIEDGIKYIQNQNNKFDVIIIDSTDPVSFAEGLFHHDFYNNVKQALKEDGIMVAQTESPFLNSDLIEKVYYALKTSFSNRYMYLAHIPTYPSGMWSFSFATKKYNPIDNMKKQDKSFYKNLKYYSEDIHKSAFALPPFVKKIIKE